MDHPQPHGVSCRTFDGTIYFLSLFCIKDIPGIDITLCVYSTDDRYGIPSTVVSFVLSEGDGKQTIDLRKECKPYRYDNQNDPPSQVEGDILDLSEL